MKPGRTVQTFAITLLTPLHVGDGETLVNGMDYILSRNELSVYHIDTLIESIADNPKAVSDLGRMNLQKFIESYRLDIQPDYTVAYTGDGPRDLKRFLKNAYGEPYLPGSTLKGAIRTALWNTLDRSRLPSPLMFYRFKKEVEGEPHNDFLRPLSISDSQGLNPRDALKAEEIRIFNVKTGNRPGWKDFSTKSTKDRFMEAAGIYVEALKPSTCLHVRVELSDFLKKPPVSLLWPVPKAGGLSGLEDLAEFVNQHSRKLAENERDFFAGYGQACAGAVGFYNDLIQKGFDMVKQIPGAFLLRMAWSSGWKGMTGDWIHGADLDAVRKEKKLGKKNVSIFPKTRRLAMKDGVPSQPMGWILVVPSSESFFKKTARPVSTGKKDQGILMKKEPVNKTPDDDTPVQSCPKEDSVTETVRETWENVTLVRTPQNDTITATSGNRKAFVKGKNLVPERLHTLLFGRKKCASGQKVEVEVEGNSFKIVKIY